MKQINDHIRAQELFSVYIDKRTTADEKAFIERHLASCDQDCRAVLAVTRSMIQTTRALPLVKAPRSFVLPKSMERKPARSIFAWYPTLRLATVAAAIALMLVFAGDVLSPRTAAFNTIPSGASAPLSAAAPVSPSANIAAQPTTAAMNFAAPEAATQTQPSAAPAPQSSAGMQPTPTSVAAADTMTLAARLAITPTEETMTTTEVVAQAPASIAQSTAEPAPKNAPAASPAANQAGGIEQAPTPSIDPLRAIEIGLALLVLLLGAATLIARRRARTR